MRNVRNVPASAAVLTLSAMFILLPAAGTVNANPDAGPRQRVEREFQQVGAALMRCIYEEVLMALDLEDMNESLFEFMHDNPGVVRVLRVNAGGHTVNDVSADSPRSAPPRNIGNQRWFQQVTQYRSPYYSMDADNESNISLFYAWPLMTGPDRSRFSGAFAALIDFNAQAALIDNTAPFQLLYRGRAFFQYDWDDLDYNEEPLHIPGAQEMTIRTLKPMPTRLDPIVRAQPESEAAPEKGEAEDENQAAALEAIGDGPERAAPNAPFSLVSIIIFAILAPAALILTHITLTKHADKQKPAKWYAPALTNKSPVESEAAARQETEAPAVRETIKIPPMPETPPLPPPPLPPAPLPKLSAPAIPEASEQQPYRLKIADDAPVPDNRNIDKRKLAEERLAMDIDKKKLAKDRLAKKFEQKKLAKEQRAIKLDKKKLAKDEFAMAKTVEHTKKDQVAMANMLKAIRKDQLAMAKLLKSTKEGLGALEKKVQALSKKVDEV